MRLIDAWVLGRLLIGEALNGELEAVSGPFRRLADHLAARPPEARRASWEAFLCGRSDADALVMALAGIDPTGPPPEAEPVGRCATLADLRRLVADDQWLWKGWLAAGVLNALAADPGTGKTVMAADLARCLWFGLDWPDGQSNPLPAGTRTLWVPGDRHYPQLISLAEKYALPDEAMIFNAPASDPAAGLDLDDPAELQALAERSQAERPGLVIVDTVGMTTGRNLCKPEDARDYFGPLMDLARALRLPFLLLTHLSKDGQALGRRISGACRLVWKMTDPDPEGQPNRRRLWVDKTYAEKPPALGMTISDAGCSFDFNPPTAPEPGKGGRPDDSKDKAKRFIRDALARQDGQVGNTLCQECIKATSVSESTFWRAVKDMTGDGEITTEGGKGTGRKTTLHLIIPDAEPDGF
jgi:hypothetical protein